MGNHIVCSCIVDEPVCAVQEHACCDDHQNAAFLAEINHSDNHRNLLNILPGVGDDVHIRPEDAGVQAMLDTATQPWPHVTTAIIQDHWYKHGGMQAVMAQYYEFHMTRETGELIKLGLSPEQMHTVRLLLDTSGELQKLLEDRILENIARENRYTSWDSVQEALSGDGCVLIRGDWLSACGNEEGGRLPRRQDLETDAAWDRCELASRLGDICADEGPIAVVAVSYRWLGAEHPDPDGTYLSLMSALLAAAEGELFTWCGKVGVKHEEHFNDSWGPVETTKDFAIFFDWCSMYQKPRQDLEENAFQKSLKDIDLWYVHQGVHSWLMAGPPDCPVACSSEDIAEHYNRAWPTFEHFLSTMCKDRDIILNLGSIPPLWRNWIDVDEHCRGMHGLPLTPERMAALLGCKDVTNEQDRRLLIRKYEEAYVNVIVKAKRLCFQDFGATSRDCSFVDEIVDFVPKCFQLQEFAMLNVPLLEADCLKLVGALGKCRTLLHIELQNTLLRDRDVESFASLVISIPCLTYLLLPVNDIGNNGVIAIAEVLPQSRVSVLRLDKNRITDQGALALCHRFLQCHHIKCLTLHDNSLTDNCKRYADEAWSAAGRPISSLAATWNTLDVQVRYVVTAAKFERSGGLFL